MKNQMRILTNFLAIFLLILNGNVYSQTKNPPIDKILSPYFLLDSADPATDQLPLKSTSAKVNIAGVIADVKITQVYKNEG